MKSDGATAQYYVLPLGAAELQDLISARDMNAQIGEIFRACYRYGQADHSDRMRDAKKIRFYAEAEILRLRSLEPVPDPKHDPADAGVVPRHCWTCKHADAPAAREPCLGCQEFSAAVSPFTKWEARK